MTFVFKDDNTIGVHIYGWKPFGQSENKPLMKTGKEETTYLLGLTGKCSVKAFVHVPVKGKKDGSPAQEPVIKDDKKRKSCLLDGGKTSGWDGKGTIKSRHHPILPGPCYTRHGGKQKISGEWICQREANNTICDHGPWQHKGDIYN